EVGDAGVLGFFHGDLVGVEALEVVRVGADGEAVGEQVVAAVAVLDFDEVALLAEVGHILDEHELHAAVLALEHLAAFANLGLRCSMFLSPEGATVSVAPSGLKSIFVGEPRALPWAIFSRRVAAQTDIRLAFAFNEGQNGMSSLPALAGSPPPWSMSSGGLSP